MVTPKKVVHLSTVHHPFDTRIFHKECVSLAKAGFDVHLLVSREDASQPQVNTIDGVKVTRLKNYSHRFGRMIFGAWAIYLEAKKLKADLYHFHDPELMWVGRLLKNKNNTVVYDIHEDYLTSIAQKTYLPQVARVILQKTYRWIEKLFTKKMHYCLAEKYYKDHYPTGKLILNYPILNAALLDRPIQAISEPTLIYTGNVTYVRGALEHANLTNIMDDAQVFFYGKAEEAVVEEMLKKADAHSIHITGIGQFVERSRIDQAYLERSYLAGLAIFPVTDHYLKKELTKFFEYMMAGIPIICSNFPVWESFIRKYNCGLVVDPNDPKTWKVAIERLQSNPQEYRDMAENGRRAVVESMNWTQESQKLISWYKELLFRESKV